MSQSIASQRLDLDLLTAVMAYPQRAVLVIELEENGLIIFVNAAFTQMTGYTADEAVGKTPHFLLGSDHGPRALELYVASTCSELRYCRKDGSEFWVESYTRTMTYGDATYLIAEQQDVTARRAAEQSYLTYAQGMVSQMEQETLRHAQSQSQTLVLAEDNAQLNQLNQSLEQQVALRTQELQKALALERVLKRIVDHVRDSIDESHILQVVVQELALALHLLACHAALYDEQNCRVLYEYRQDNISSFLGQSFAIADLGQLSTLETPLQIWPIKDDQQIIGHLGLYSTTDFQKMDVHLLHQVASQCGIAIRQARLYQASQVQIKELQRLAILKEDFLSSVSHELRTPISNIKIAIQMLKGKVSPTQKDRYLDILEKECQREITLINNLLRLQEITAEEDEPLALETLTLRTWLLPILDIFETRIREQGQYLCLQLPEILPSIDTEKLAIECILRELLHNACKYTPEGETITVQVCPNASGLILSVCNTGVVIAPSELPHIFDKFYRIPSADPWQRGGTGLGLALAKKMVTRLGGTIVAQSDQGRTLLTVTLPLLSIDP